MNVTKTLEENFISMEKWGIASPIYVNKCNSDRLMMFRFRDRNEVTDIFERISNDRDSIFSKFKKVKIFGMKCWMPFYSWKYDNGDYCVVLQAK